MPAAVSVVAGNTDDAGSFLLSVGDVTQKRHEAPVRVAFMPSSCHGCKIVKGGLHQDSALGWGFWFLVGSLSTSGAAYALSDAP